MSCVKPSGDKILVRYRKREHGLVIIPDFVEEDERFADVLAVGPDVSEVKSGDVIQTFYGVCGDEYEGNNFINEKFILGVMDGDLPRPLGDRVLVRPEKHPDKFGSIYIPDTAKKKMLYGVVIAVGNGNVINGERQELDLEVGDKVVYGEYAGGYDGFKINGIPHLSMREQDIFGVIG